MAPYNRKSTLYLSPNKRYCSEIDETRNYKTELCKFYEKGVKCKYGDSCTYAHGDHELKKHEAENPQDDSYRLLPCFIWMSTGSCPFNGRCQRLHDPRATGSTSYWLPHLMKPRVLPSFTSQVDLIYHLQLNSISNNSPFGYKVDNWAELYKSLCNLPITHINRIPHKTKAEIALRMHYHQEKKGSYAFKPNYLLCGKPCMVLQTKAFLLDQGKISDISIQQYYSLHDDKDKTTILAKEIAFGPLGKISACRLGIWFDIPPKALVPKDANAKIDHSNVGMRFLPETPFYITETLDDNAYQLVKDALQFYVLHHNSLEDANNHSITEIHASLKSRFENAMHHYSAWSWPANSNGFAADVNALYDFDGDEQSHLKTLKLWKSFLAAMSDKTSPDHIEEHSRYNKFIDTKKKNSSTRFYHINNNIFRTNNSSKKGDSCWKSLLLSDNNEWEILKNHYTSVI